MSLSIWNTLDRSLSESEHKYMSEVLGAVSTEVNQGISRYVHAVEAFSQNLVLRNFLLDVEANFTSNNVEDIFEFEGIELVLAELNTVAELFLLENILDIGLGSIYLDNFITNAGTVGGADFSLASRPYYEVVTQKSTYLSDPYEDFLSKTMVVSVVQPIFDETGRSIGLILIDVVLDGLIDNLGQRHFGETGSTYIIDSDYQILMHPEHEYIGTDVRSVNYGGEVFLEELQNPTGNMFTYDLLGSKRVGGIQGVSDLTGWKIVSAMDQKEFKSPIYDVLETIIVTQIIIVCLSTIFCLYGIKEQLLPLKKMEEYIRKIAHGDLSADLDIETNDEIGDLAQEVVRCSESLKATISHIDDTLIEFGEGNFQLRDDFDYLGDFASIQGSMNRFVELMSGSLVALKGTSEEVGQGANLVSDRAQELATGSSEQAMAVVSLQNLIAGIHVTIAETAENSAVVTENAQKISSNLLVSKEKTLELAESVKDIKGMSDEVKRIIKAIEEVAFQTNILALNAAVEAARAGQAGKGFAVVAEEVRNLSLKTAEAVEDTTKIINDIANAIETGSELAQENSKGIQDVVSEVEVFVGKLSDISFTAQNQAMDIDEINKGIAQISSVVNQNSAISEESAAASEELSSQSSLMIEKIEGFRV